MKKIILTLTCLITALTATQAQSFAKGTNVISLDAGIGGVYGLPITLSYERGVYDINDRMSIGVGGTLGYAFDNDKLSYGTMKQNYTLIGAQGNYHYTAINKLDLYAGLVIGYNIATAKFEWNEQYRNLGVAAPSASASGLLWGLKIGAKYYFNDNFGINGELGYGLAYLNIGVNYKF